VTVFNLVDIKRVTLPEKIGLNGLASSLERTNDDVDDVTYDDDDDDASADDDVHL